MRCAFQADETRRVRAIVTSPRPAPALGETFKIVFDPRKPTVAEAAHYLESKAPMFPYFLQAALLITAGSATVLTVLS
ncbi:hypothetical protein [Streptomyces xanthophaeus]